MLGKVDIVIDQLAVIRGTPVLAEIFGYPLLTGEAKETAGGMLIAVAKKDADDLWMSWISGRLGILRLATLLKARGTLMF